MEKLKQLAKKVLPFWIMAVFILPSLASAIVITGGIDTGGGGGVGGGGVTLPQPTTPVGGAPITLDYIGQLIQRIAQFLITFGVIIAVIFIIYGGIRWVVSPDKADKAKAIIKNGVIGAAIILGVGVIIQTIAAVVNRQFFGV